MRGRILWDFERMAPNLAVLALFLLSAGTVWTKAGTTDVRDYGVLLAVSGMVYSLGILGYKRQLRLMELQIRLLELQIRRIQNSSASADNNE